MMEKYQNRRINIDMIFIDFKKRYDRIPRDVLWKVLEKRGVSIAYIKVKKKYL